MAHASQTRSSLMPATTLSDLPAEVIHQILCELDEETLLVVSELDQCINRLALQAFFGATQGGTQLDRFPPPYKYSSQLLYHGLRMAVGLERIITFDYCIWGYLSEVRRQLCFLKLCFKRLQTIRVFCLSIKIDTQSSGRISLKEEIWGPSTRDGDKLMFELQELVDLVISKGCQKILIGTPDKDYFPPSRLSSSQIRSVLFKHTLAGTSWRWEKSKTLPPTSPNIAQTLKLKDYTLWGSPFLGPTALSYNLNLLEQCTNTMHRLELNTEGVTRSNSKLKALLSGLLNDIHLPNLKYFLLTTKTRLIQYSYLIWFLSRHHGLAGLHIANVNHPTTKKSDSGNTFDTPLIHRHVHLPELGYIRCSVHIAAWLFKNPYQLPATIGTIHLNGYGHWNRLTRLGGAIHQLRQQENLRINSLTLDAEWWGYAKNVSSGKYLDTFGTDQQPKLNVGRLVLVLSLLPESCTEVTTTTLGNAFIDLMRRVVSVEEVEILPRLPGQSVLQNSRRMVQLIENALPDLRSVKCECTVLS